FAPLLTHSSFSHLSSIVAIPLSPFFLSELEERCNNLWLATASDPRVNKVNRAAGVLDNFAEGEKYAENFLRKFERNREPEIMPSLNRIFTDPSRN
ncbi:hypothetical protein Lal_00015243, partial [Lupinus albus]